MQMLLYMLSSTISRGNFRGGNLKIFIDTAKLEEIEKAYSYGILDGVTTNPSLIKSAVDEMKKDGKKIDIVSYIKKLLLAAKGICVSLEVIGSTYDDMLREGLLLYKLFNPVAKNVYIKIPVNPSFELGSSTSFDGIKAIKALADRKIPVNCTLVFTPEQALLAAKAGAKIVSPFAGRIDDMLRSEARIPFGKSDYYPADGMKREGQILVDKGIVSGVDLVKQCCIIFKNYNLECEVLAASIRNARQLRECAFAGADIATVPFDVLLEVINHRKTVEGMKKFTEDVVPEYARLLKSR